MTNQPHEMEERYFQDPYFYESTLRKPIGWMSSVKKFVDIDQNRESSQKHWDITDTSSESKLMDSLVQLVFLLFR